MKSRVFKDRVKVYVRGGRGGDGCVSFRREKFVPRGGPDGGDGGRGGSVYMEADQAVDSLAPLYYQPHQYAENGERGRGKGRHGADGKDLVLRVPCGTVATDAASGKVLGEVVRPGDRLLLARGGAGGRGNKAFATSTDRAPRRATPGEEGEERSLWLELKTVADIGLVGYPNAGKSTLLRRISRARPKVADYPFTTLNPVIGTVQFEDYCSLRVADIPGLIEGAHAGVGLGHDFLRHIERTRFLLFVVDMAATSPDPQRVYETLRQELEKHRADLGRRPSLVVANKMDLPAAGENLERFRRAFDCEVLPVSALTGLGVGRLLDRLHAIFHPVKAEGSRSGEDDDRRNVIKI